MLIRREYQNQRTGIFTAIYGQVKINGPNIGQVKMITPVVPNDVYIVVTVVIGYAAVCVSLSDSTEVSSCCCLASIVLDMTAPDCS